MEPNPDKPGTKLFDAFRPGETIDFGQAPDWSAVKPNLDGVNMTAEEMFRRFDYEQAGQRLLAQLGEPFDAKIIDSLRDLAKKQDIVIVTPRSTTRLYRPHIKSGLGLPMDDDGLVWISLEQGNQWEQAMMRFHRPDSTIVMDVETDQKFPVKNNPTYILTGGRRIGKTQARTQFQGGFAQVEMDRDVRSRSERRGHKPKKQLRGQDYLTLRKGY